MGLFCGHFFCTKSGLPISVTHALVGGLLGAGLAAGGINSIQWGIFNEKVLLGIVLSPATGFLAGAILLIIVSWILEIFYKKTPTNKLNKFFRIAQIFSTPFVSFTHGMNDAQNAMGIIAATLLVGGYIDKFYVPWWVKITCGVAMGLGTFLMGWKVVKTLGWNLTRIEPKHGFSAQLAAGSVTLLHSIFGIPISTTHVICSAVIGGTVLENPKRIKQIVARNMVIAWITTIPLAALSSAFLYLILNRFICNLPL